MRSFAKCFCLLLYLIFLPQLFANDASSHDDISIEDLVDTSELEAHVRFLRAATFAKSGTKLHFKSMEAPVPIYVVTRKQIEALCPNSLGEILRLIPSLDMFRLSDRNYSFGPSGVANQYSNEALIMIDGIPHPTQRGGGADLAALPISVEHIERIEVFSGALSALNGAYAASGVINIITQRGNPELWQEGNSVSARVGNDDRQRIDLMANVKKGKTAFTVWGKGSTSEGFGEASDALGQVPAGFLDRDGSRERIGGFTISQKLDERQSIVSDFSLFNADYELLQPSHRHDYKTNENRLQGNIRYENVKEKDHSFTFSFAYQNFDILRSEAIYSAYGFNDVEERFWSRQLEARYNFHGGKGQRYSAGILYDKLVASGWELTPGDHSIEDTSLFGLADIPVARTDRLILGFNQFHSSASGRDFTYNVALVHKFNEREALRASYGTGVRAPDLKTLYHPVLDSITIGGTTYNFVRPFVAGNENLENGELCSYQLGYEKTLENGSVRLDLYRYCFHDRVTMLDTGLGVGGPAFFSHIPSFLFVNDQRVLETNGVIMTWDQKLSAKLNASAAFRHQRSEYDTGTTRMLAPHNLLILSSTYWPKPNLSINLVSRTVASYRTYETQDLTIDGYSLVDLAIRHKLPRGAQCWLAINNVLDDVHKEVYSMPTGTDFTAAPLGRSVTIGYRLSF